MATQCTNIRIIAQKFFIGLDTSNCQKFWPTYISIYLRCRCKIFHSENNSKNATFKSKSQSKVSLGIQGLLVCNYVFNLKDICCDQFNCPNQHLFELSDHCGLQQTLNKFHFRFFLHTSQLTEHYCSTVSAFYGLVVLLALSFNQKLTWFRYILGNFPFFIAKINGIGTSKTYL